jgi:hypothetical protein
MPVHDKLEITTEQRMEPMRHPDHVDTDPHPM